MSRFVGRENEIEVLKSTVRPDRAALVALYGRRRVGKTSLVERVFSDKPMWKFEGLEGSSTRVQIRHFMEALRIHCGKNNVVEQPVRTWTSALRALARAMPKKKPPVIFFDEFQWMASMRSPLVSALKWAWDNHFSKIPGSMFIVCGSISSFIVGKVIRSRAFYGRINLELHLKPLTLPEIREFIGNGRAGLEILDIAATLGGIPQYLQELETGKSLTQNLGRMAFSPSGYFFNEYQRLFISHFSKNELYQRVLKSLGRKPSQDRSTLSRHTKTTMGGGFSRILEDLELAGFIQRVHPLDKSGSGRLMRIELLDEFLHFYFQMVEPNRSAIEAGMQPADVLTGPSFDRWRGYAFERLCRRNADGFAQALGFSGIRYAAGPWFRRHSPAGGAQIDLAFLRADRIATLCEIKSGRRIPVNLVREFQRKVDAFLSVHSLGIQKVLILAQATSIPSACTRYFDAILPVEKVFLEHA